MAYRTRSTAAGVTSADFQYVGPAVTAQELRSSITETQRRRYQRRKANTVGHRYVLAEIAKRDNYRCHLCGKRVDMALSGRHPQGPTADHLIPVAHGGGDDPHNVALAHSRCNIKRSTGGQVQLRLVG